MDESNSNPEENKYPIVPKPSFPITNGRVYNQDSTSFPITNGRIFYKDDTGHIKVQSDPFAHEWLRVGHGSVPEKDHYKLDCPPVCHDMCYLYEKCVSPCDANCKTNPALEEKYWYAANPDAKRERRGLGEHGALDDKTYSEHLEEMAAAAMRSGNQDMGVFQQRVTRNRPVYSHSLGFFLTKVFKEFGIDGLVTGIQYDAAVDHNVITITVLAFDEDGRQVVDNDGDEVFDDIVINLDTTEPIKYEHLKRRE